MAQPMGWGSCSGSRRDAAGALGTRLLHPLLPGEHTGLYPSLFLAGFRDELVMPCHAFGQTFSHFAALVVISVVCDGKAVSTVLH